MNNLDDEQLKELQRISDPNESSLKKVMNMPEVAYLFAAAFKDIKEPTPKEKEREMIEHEKFISKELKRRKIRRKKELRKTLERIERLYGVKLRKITTSI